MSEENVVRLCAPTLAGIKTGSLFPCPFENRETLLMEIRQYNQVLVPKGLCLLRCDSRTRARCCICTAHAIWRDLQTSWQQRFCGTQAVLRQQRAVPMKLIERLRAYDEFPTRLACF
ncbi:MAG: DUF3793 family protein [Oscillospiraceae bacterium]